MGTQHSTVGRTKSLDEATVERLRNSTDTTGSASTQLRRNGSAISSTGAKSRLQRDQRSKSTLVIVNRPSDPPYGSSRLEDDPLFKKLIELPSFVSLLHEVDTSSNLFGAKTRALSEIRGKVDPVPFTRIVRLYENRLKKHAQCVSGEQKRLSKLVRDTDVEITSIFRTLTDRQKRFAKHTEHLGKNVEDSKNGLLRLQQVLKECERNLQILNGMLTIEDRLEPFSWPGLFDDDDENPGNSLNRNSLIRKGSDATEINEDFKPESES